MLIWQEVQVLHHIDGVLFELLDLLHVADDIMAKVLDGRVLNLVLKRVDKDTHGVLEGGTASFLSNTTQDDDSSSQVLVDVLQDLTCAFDELMIEDLALFPGLIAELLCLLK